MVGLEAELHRIIAPVRAWADYDEWLVFLELRERTDRVTFDRWFVPKSGRGQLFQGGDFAGVAAALKADGPMAGSLQSLRVLCENGYVLLLESWPDGYGWYVYPSLEDARRVEMDSDRFVASGMVAEDKDSEAVERAMTAAAAWFTQRQEVG